MNVVLSRSSKILYVFGQLDYFKELSKNKMPEFSYSQKMIEYFNVNPNIVYDI